MAKRIFYAANQTYTPTADSAAHANATYMAMKGGSTTQMIDLLEIMTSGMSGASSPVIMQMARTAVLGITPTALAAPNSDGPAHPATAALAAPPITYVAAATGPQRSALTTDGRLNVGLNTFGGILRWNAAPTQQWTLLGNALGLGESIMSQFTGGTAGATANSHMMYEPY